MDHFREPPSFFEPRVFPTPPFPVEAKSALCGYQLLQLEVCIWFSNHGYGPTLNLKFQSFLLILILVLGLDFRSYLKIQQKRYSNRLFSITALLSVSEQLSYHDTATTCFTVGMLCLEWSAELTFCQKLKVVLSRHFQPSDWGFDSLIWFIYSCF